MFKIYNNLVPQYLKGISPNIRGNLRAYDTRNSNEYAIPRCIPDTVGMEFFELRNKGDNFN